MYGRHQESLRNITHLAGIADGCSSVALTDILRDLLQVAVVHLADASVIPRVVSSSPDSVVIFFTLHTSIRNELVYNTRG